MKTKYKSGQQVYFLICGRYVTKATVVTASSWFVTIRFNKNAGESIIRLPHNRIFATEEEARKHIHPDLLQMSSKILHRKVMRSLHRSVSSFLHSLVRSFLHPCQVAARQLSGKHIRVL